MNRRIFDVSLSISSELHVWPGDPSVRIDKNQQLKEGDVCNIIRLDIGSHAGTHIDAPYHFEEDGVRVDDLDVSILLGRARIFSLHVVEKIDVDDLAPLDFSGIKRVLFSTRNSELWKYDRFCEDFVYITPSAAQFLVDSGVKLVGIDYLSVERFGSTEFHTHHIFLRNNVVILEGLNLECISPGDYELIALPLKIRGGDGAPARVLLRELTAS